MRASIYRAIGLVCMLSLSTPLAALDLVDAYNLAVDHDPVLRAARFQRDAGAAGRAVGRAGLLPQLDLSYTNAPTNEQQAWYPARNAAGEPVEGYERREYDSYAAFLTLEQPLIDLEAWARYRQASAQALFADERLRASSQELAARVLSAYTDVLYAQDKLAFSLAQQRTLLQQQQQNQRLLDEGEGTRTDLIETQARYGIATAQDLEARDALQAARRSLEALTGTEIVEALAPLQAQFEALPLTPVTFEEWQVIALDHNALLAAQRHNIDALSQEIQRRRSGHYPKVSAYASGSQTHSETANTYNQRYRTYTFGLRVTMSLYAGGGTEASARQSTLSRDAARADLDAQVAETLTELRKQYDVCRSAPAKIRAYERAVESAELLVEATRRSVESGTRVNLDVLNAEQQLSQARRDLAASKYTYLKAQLELRRLAGVLEAEDLQRIGAYFTTEARPVAAAGVVRTGQAKP